MSNSVRPHRRQPSRLPRPWDSPGRNTGVGCHFLLQCMKVKSESEVAQSCLTLSDPMDCSLPGSSVHGIFQAGVLEWGTVAFSGCYLNCMLFTSVLSSSHNWIWTPWDQTQAACFHHCFAVLRALTKKGTKKRLKGLRQMKKHMTRSISQSVSQLTSQNEAKNGQFGCLLLNSGSYFKILSESHVEEMGVYSE